MSDAFDDVRAPRLHRVVLALTRREIPGGALARLLQVVAPPEPPELRAVFIEDADLLNAVALPFTSEWCRLTNVLRPIDRARLEAHFARESAAAAEGVATLVRGLGWQCRFEVLRARKSLVLHATLRESDALLLPGTPATRQLARAVVLALVDGGASGARCRALAERVAQVGGAPLEVVEVDGTNAVPLAQVPRQLARADTSVVLLAASLVPRLGHDAAELDELCPAPLLVIN